YYIIKNHKGGFDKIGWIHAIFLGLSVPIICFLALIAYIPLAFAYGYSLYALMQAGFIIFIGIIIVQKIRKNKTRL
ncbi:MAG: hypothetical protein NTZ84_03245, partial [Candidatus Nealsonbacteria bacterium]|nr:hypothetical protein [Candidatus Nealsonbacteria bacterium]